MYLSVIDKFLRIIIKGNDVWILAQNKNAAAWMMQHCILCFTVESVKQLPVGCAEIHLC